MNIHIIGGGNLGTALAIGIANFTKGNKITVTRRNINHIRHLEPLGIKLSTDNKAGIEDSELIILSIKPYQVDGVLDEISAFCKGKIVASAVTGLSLEELHQKMIGGCSIIRIMPNIAAQFGESATCLAYAAVDEKSGEKVSNLFNQVGSAVRIEEKLMDAATVLGACGTAYALRYIRASMQAGIEIGFDAATALTIASQTAKGAAKMALEENVHPEQLIDRVTTPQGCTIVGLNEMEHQGFSSALIRGIKTSLEKIK
jgi:pyrroline-5-carboxylate reductase